MFKKPYPVHEDQAHAVMAPTVLARTAFLVIVLLYNVSVNALPEESLVPGGIALLKLKNHDKNTKVYFNNKRIAIFQHDKQWFAMAGISLATKPGNYVFSIKQASKNNSEESFSVVYKKYDEQRLIIKNKRKVNPNEQDTKRIIAESKRKKSAKQLFTEHTPNVDFIWPVNGRISSIFGLRRFFNDQERRPHSGLDIAADEGTAVKATASGTVIDSGDFFFSGNMVYLDHGQGIISLYAHLSAITVKTGDTVTQGDIIGKVGQTGRVTGPHLHFAVISNQTLIDPIYMLPEGGNTASNATPGATLPTNIK